MADLIKKIKIKKQDGTFTDYIPIGAEAQNVNVDGESVKLKLNKKLYYYDTVADMKADTKLKAGDVVQTLGYYEANDGGKGLYKIRNITNADTIDEMFVIALSNQNIIAELIYNTNINILSLGAKGNATFDNKSIIDSALLKLTSGGDLYFPEGKYVTTGNHIIDVSGKLTIKGAGQFATSIIYIGNNICFSCKNENNHLFVPVEFKDFRIRGTDSESQTIAFRLSDRWGYKIKNIFSEGFDNGTFCQLYNDLLWTEGTVVENVVIRNALNGFMCKRNTERSQYDSFFNTKIINVSMSIKTNCCFINLKETENENFPIIAYNWIVNSTIWAEGNPHYIKVGAYNYLSGNLILVQDAGDAPIIVYDNGLCDVEGQIIYRQGIKILNLNRKLFSLLKQYTRWQRTSDCRPLARFKGLRIFGGSTIESSNTNSVIYNSDYLPPFTNYKLTIKGHIVGTSTEFNYEFFISLLDANHNPLIELINVVGDYNTPYIYPRPLNNGTPGDVQSNQGLQFDIFIKELAQNVEFNFELEMM